MHHQQAKPTVIQLSSPDLIYEWDVPSNTLFLTDGLRKRLHLGPDNIISRPEFTSHIPPDNIRARAHLVEELLTGNTSTFLEMFYPFDSLVLHSFFFVVRREANGAARTILAYIAVQEGASDSPTQTSEETKPLQGFLQYNISEGIISMDSNCAVLLCYEKSAPRTISIDEFLDMVAVEDMGGMTTRAKLFFDHNQWGDHFEEIIRMRRQDGVEARFALQVSVLKRNELRQAVNVVGSMRLVDEFVAPPRNTNLIQAISSSGDGLWDWDVEHNTVSYSARYLAMLGYTPEEFPSVPESWIRNVHPDDIESAVTMQLSVISSPVYGDSFECSYRMRKADDTWAWILDRGYVSHRDKDGRATRMVGLHTDITVPQGNRAQLEDAVNTDQLTGLRSRWFFNAEVQRAEHSLVRPASIIVFDLDGLKLINDYLGHECGDIIIREFAMIMRRHVRSTDCVARMGGDEFFILLQRCSAENAQRIMKDIADDIKNFNTKKDVIPLHVSMASSTTETMETTILESIVKADKRMLRQKHANRDAALNEIKRFIETTTNQIVTINHMRYQSNIAST